MMRKVYIDIGEQKWGIILCYGYSYKDEDEIRALMSAFGLTRKAINEALIVLSDANSAMAISRADLQMSLVFISHATSVGQLWNSVNHELHHVGEAITDFYGEPSGGEPAAYLQGYLLQQIVERIAPPCS